eukprot:TRINITY_DN13029_c0_g1_i1.p1 TRINITY_DN13029_c0_g1~~TRINITY_DN13029_c0_g1_i1.p1  ORF type:complete len:156 (+),score=41.65 TRINITY_DN13029_c0_g1_i1:61-468(+)
MCIRDRSGHTDSIVCHALFTSLMRLMTGSLDGTIRLWSLIDFRCERIIKLPHRPLKWTDMIYDDDLILLTFEDSTIMVFDLLSETVKWQYKYMDVVKACYWLAFPSEILIIGSLGAKILNLYWKCPEVDLSLIHI